MTINICGIPYEVIEREVIDEEVGGITQGKILFSQAKILLKKDLPKALKKSVMYHEIFHGILQLTGYSELSDDETFVQCISNVIYQMFDLKESILDTKILLIESVPMGAKLEKSTIKIEPTQELINEFKKEKNNMEKGCTSCPYAGHIELKECAYAYTEDAKDCALYSHEEMEKNTDEDSD